MTSTIADGTGCSETLRGTALPTETEKFTLVTGRASSFWIARFSRVFDSHGYIQTTTPEDMLTLVDRGADTLANAKRIDSTLAEDPKQAARRRAEQRRVFWRHHVCQPYCAKRVVICVAPRRPIVVLRQRAALATMSSRAAAQTNSTGIFSTD
jgi:hypothetical protein